MYLEVENLDDHDCPSVRGFVGTKADEEMWF